MNSTSIVLLVLIILLLVGLPQTGLHSFGYYPSSGLGLLVVILIILILAGKI